MRVRKKCIGNIAKIVAGGTPSRGVKSYYNGSIPWVKTLDLNFGIVVETEERITTEGLFAIRGRKNPPGTVMIAMYGGAGTIGKSGVLGVEAATNQAVASILPNPDIFDSDFLHYQLIYLRGEWMQFSQGNRKDPNINKSVVTNMLIWLPDKVSAQRQIAARLKAQLAEVEKARQASEEQLEECLLLRNRVQKNIFAELDHAPKKRLGDFADTASGSTPSRGNKEYWQPADIAWVKTGEVAFEPIKATEEAISKTALSECSLTLLPPKTILIAMYGQGKTRGQSAILEMHATTNQACFAILPNETWTPDFLYLWLKASYQDLRDLSEDRGGNQSNLNGALLKALHIPAPSIFEQQQIVTRVNQALFEIDKIKKSSKAALEGITLLPKKILAQAFEI